MAQVALPASPPRRRRVSEEAVSGWISISPWLIGFLVFTLGPLVASFYISFTRYDVLTPPQWIGLANYERLLTNDSTFFKALRNTLVYTALYVPLTWSPPSPWRCCSTRHGSGEGSSARSSTSPRSPRRSPPPTSGC